MLEEGTRLRMKCLLESKLDETSDGFFSLTCFCGARSVLYVHKSDAVAYVFTTGWMVVGGEVFCPRCAAYAIAEVVDKLLSSVSGGRHITLLDWWRSPELPTQRKEESSDES